MSQQTGMAVLSPNDMTHRNIPFAGLNTELIAR